MGLPDTIRVKISSEAAEWIALTPVVARDMPVRELIEMMLGLTGKNPLRVRELLLRGTLVSGASRFRWQGWDADAAGIEAALAAFPDPDPSLEFSADRCSRVVLKSSGARIELPRDVASERRLFRRHSFWEVLMEFAAAVPPRYHDYSYKEKADIFVAEVDSAAAARFRESAGALRYSSIDASLRRAVPEAAEFYVPRGSA